MDHQFFQKHAIIDSDSLPWGAFWRTISLLKTVFNIDCVELGFTEPGWNTPEYRLRHHRFFTLREFRLTQQQKARLHAIELTLLARLQELDFSFIEERLVRRFGLSDDQARLALVAYKLFLNHRMSVGNYEPVIIPEALVWAWHEHVLWTDVYQSHCDTLCGRFIDRPELYWNERGSLDQDLTPHWLQPLNAHGLLELLFDSGWAVSDSRLLSSLKVA